MPPENETKTEDSALKLERLDVKKESLPTTIGKIFRNLMRTLIVSLNIVAIGALIAIGVCIGLNYFGLAIPVIQGLPPVPI